MSQIPHPFVEESMDLFSKLSNHNKNKIYFIHMNHTNPLLVENSKEKNKVIKNGFNISCSRFLFMSLTNKFYHFIIKKIWFLNVTNDPLLQLLKY